MENKAQQRTWKSWVSGLMAVVLLIAMFPLAPERASAAGTISVTMSNANAVAGDVTDINVSYTNTALLGLNIGALDFILPAGVKATTSDQFGGQNLTPSQILDNGQRVRVSPALLTLLGSSTVTLSLKQKQLPTSGNYNFEARTYGLNVNLGGAPTDTQIASLGINALTLTLSLLNVTNNPGDSDTVAVSGVRTGDIIKIYNPDASLKTQLTAQADGTLTVPLTLNPVGGTISVSQTRGGIESLRLPVVYLAEIVPPVLLTSVYVSNQSGNSDTVTVNNLTPGDSVRIYDTLTGTAPLATSSAVPTGQASVTVPTPLAPVGGTLYVSRVRNGIESARTLVAYLPEVVAALTSNLVTITNASGSADLVRVTGLTQGDIVRVYATDGTLLDSLTAGSGGIAQGTIALTPGGGTVNLVLERNGVQSLALPVVYVAEVVRSLLASEITIQNNTNDDDLITVTGLREGDRVILGLGTGTPITSDPANSSGSVDIPATLLPNGGSLTLSILRNTIEGPTLNLLYDPERVEAPLPGNITVVNASGNADTVTVRNLLAGDEIIVYGSAGATSALGRQTASTTSATANVQLTPGGGTAYVSIQRHGIESTRTAVSYNSETVAAPPLNTITVTNSPFATDSIVVTGLAADDAIRVYQADGTTLIGTANATGSPGSYTASLTNQTLTPTGGSVQVSIVRNTVESPQTAVSYNAEFVAPPAPATITVTNNANQNADTISVTALQPGDLIRVYQNGTQTNEFAASGSTASGQVNLTGTGGTLSVSIVRNGVESTRTTITYAAEIPNFTGSVSVVNAEGNADTFNLTGVPANTAIEVFSAINGGGTSLGSGTVGATGNLSIPVQLVPAGGTLSFSFTPQGSGTRTVNVTYGAEPVSPPDMNNIVPANNTGDGDTVTVSGLQAGDLVRVRLVNADGTLSDPAEATAAGSGSDYSALVNLTLVPSGGAIAVTITRNGITSEATRVNYPTEVVNAPAIADIVISNNSGTGDSVTVNNLTNNDKITVTSFDASGVRVDQVEPTASGASASAALRLSPTGGYVTVAITRNTIVSAETRVNYNAEVVQAPGPDDIAITNAGGSAQDRVVVTNLSSGDYVTVVAYDADDVEVASRTVAAQGSTATANVALAPAGGHVTVAIVRYSTNGTGGVSSAETRVSYSAEVVPPPGVGNITVTNNTGESDTVAVSGLQAGDQIRVYDADGSRQLGTATASNGLATADVQLVPGGGAVRVTIVRNTLESQSTQVSYPSEVVPAPAVSDVAVVNTAGPGDTVTVSGLRIGDLVTVTESGKQPWTGTVTSGTSVQIPVTLNRAGGVVGVTVTRNTIVSASTGVPYAAEVIATPSASDITVFNVSNAAGVLDSVEVRGVTAGDIVRVYDSSYTEIGFETAGGASVTVNIPGNLAPAGGSLFVALDRDGLLSSYVPIAYGAETVEPIDIARVSANNAVGSGDTLTVGGLNGGETLRVYRANGTTLNIQPSAGNPSVYETTFAAGGETLTLVRVRNDIESTGITFAVGAEAVPSVNANNVTVANNTGTQDSVTISVAPADYRAGDVYIVYDANSNELGRSATYANGGFAIPVTLIPAGGSVLVALERGSVVGPTTNVSYAAEAIQPNAGPAADDITVTNGEDDNDPVVVDNVAAGDIVVVYAAGGAELGRATASADGSITVLVNLADGSGGTIEVAVIRDGAESARTPKTYAAYDPAQPPVPEAAQVTVVRSSDPAEEDIVTVTGLAAADDVEFFDDEDTNIGTATANTSGVAVLRTLRLKSYASTLKLNVLRAGVSSGPLAVAYPAETSAVPAPAAANIAVNNAAGASNDTVTVSGVSNGDRVRVYTANGATLLGESTATGTTAIVPVQLGASAGNVRVSIVRGNAESTGTLKPYAAEPTATPAPAAADISVVNAPGTANDAVIVLGVASGDIVRVYSADGTAELGERTSTGTSVVIPVALDAGAGTVNVSVERGGFESPRTSVSYGAETAPKPDAPTVGNITVTNDAGTTTDRVTVDNVQSGDRIRVYEAGIANPIGQATATAASATIPVTLKSEGGSVTVTIERAGAVSDRSAAVAYPGDPAPPAPAAGNITVTNAAGNTSDRVVVVEDVQPGDLVRVYNANGTVQLGQLVATDTTVEIPVELNASGGSVRVTIERGGVESSLSVPVSYEQEPAPAAPAASAISVSNQTGTTNDTVTVTTGNNVNAGDILRVYGTDGTTLLGQRTATATETVIPVVLNAAGGTVQVRIERNNLQGTLSAPVRYGAEPAAPTAPSAPAAGSITVLNPIGTADDTVEVTNVQAGDIVRVYGANGTTLLGQHAVPTGETSAVVAVALDPAGGTVRVRIERDGLQSALSAPVTYVAEPAGPTAPAAPALGSITVDNQTGTTNDSVTVSDVVAGDIVRVYAADGTTLLGQSTAEASAVEVAVILLADGGAVQIRIERNGLQSALSGEKTYSAEPEAPTAPDAPSAANVQIANEPGTANDTVEISGVAPGDIVRVYSEDGTRVLGQATASASTVTVPVELTTGVGNVAVSITRDGLESEKTEVGYSAETVPNLDGASFATTVYSDGSGTVVVSDPSILAGDTIILSGGVSAQATAVSDGIVTIPVPSGFDAGGGSFDAVRERDGITSAPLSSPNVYNGAATSAAPTPSVTQIVYSRDAGTVTVSGLEPNDTVSVTVDGVQVETGTVGTGETTATAAGFEFRPQGGTIQVIVNRGTDSGAPVTVVYDAVAPQDPIDANITVNNNTGSTDSVVIIAGVQEGDHFIVYGSDGTTILGQATATTSSPTLEIPVALNPAGGSVQVSVTRYGLESGKVTKPYTGETSNVTAPADTDITVNNITGNDDNVQVQNIRSGDTVTVYTADGSAVLGRATAQADGTLTIPVTLLGGGGGIQVSVTRGGTESAKTDKGYAAEPGAVTAPDESDITVTNNAGNGDSVQVNGLQAGDVVTVYAADGVAILGKETANGTSLTIDVTLLSGGGEIEVSITRGTTESAKTEKSYGVEPGGIQAPAASDITYVNNTGSNDTVTVDNVQAGDIVTVYSASGVAILGQAEAASGETAVTIPVTLDSEGGGIRVSIIRGGIESSKTPQTYAAETSSVPQPSATDITVTNNTGNGDQVTVTSANLQVGDVVTVYAANGVTVLGLAEVTTAGTVTLNVTLGAAAGDVQVAITRGNVQSAKTTKPYAAESSSVPVPTVGNIQVTNNLGSQDSVTINNVQVGDTYTVYASNGTTILARATATEAGRLTIPVTLPEGSSAVNVTLTRGNVESAPASSNYTAEPTTLDAPAAAGITVNNITGSSDNVTLTNLQAGDIITVYAANGTTILDRVTVGSDPATWVIPVTLNPSGGNVQVSITRGGIESSRTTVSYGAEPSLVPAPAPASVAVNNNGAAGSSVVVSNVQPGDIVTVYAANGTTIIGRAQVQPGATSVAIPVSLDEAGGNIQVTLTRGATQSAPTPIVYPARIEEEEPGTGVGGGDGGTAPAGPVTPANPVTPETNPVTPETEGEGEELDVPGRIVTLTMREPRTFNDISGYWAQSAIERLAALGVIDGLPDGSFAPRETLSRAQFTKMVATLLGINSQNSPIFSDTPAGRWYTASIQGAYEQGIVNGYTGGNFDPDEPVTREEMAKILTNAMLWLNPDVFPNSPDYAAAEAFRDYDRVGNWAKEPISRMLEEGILIGKTNGVLDPKGNATRAEAATVLVRLIERMSDNFTS
ncbi:S-layer homology domain-containing protein [Saccharibacillus endophyticus]|nr:S-layer homology domain-containing protein [Saccharibacillus endophyticus]